MTLAWDDFPTFFQDVHGYEPFPWQVRLIRRIAETGDWPRMLDLPTGSGKTAAIDVAVFHLALEAMRFETRRAPVRICLVVDRRLVVDDAFTRAARLECALSNPSGEVTARVAERLRRLSGDGRPLIARRLRGGIPREDDWARTPSQPTVLCSTIDQVGSRLLFRGYGVSDSMKPLHAGLLGSDCLILLDEAHLAEPFRQTLEWLDIYRGERWRESNYSAPWGVALLTATPGEEPHERFTLDDDDRSHPVLKRRLNASKPVRIVGPPKGKGAAVDITGAEDNEEEGADEDHAHRATAIVAEIRRALEHFKSADNGVPKPAIGAVVNRVTRARAVFELVKREFKDEIESGEVGEPILMIGPARSLDRDQLADTVDPIRTRIWSEGESRVLDRSFLLIATQCVEVGVDMDLDALISEVAPLDALRQRFGRLNRAGRDIVPYGSIVATKSDTSARSDDPVYGKALKPAWDRLKEALREGRKTLDFGLNAFRVRVTADALALRADAPVLLPAHLDLFSQTAPVPGADPDLALFLHGPKRQPDAITVVWRADIDAQCHRDEDVRRLLMLVPPRPAEAIELPTWVVRRWLREGGRILARLADIATIEPEEENRQHSGNEGRRVFCWKGDDDGSRWIIARDLRPGDTIVAPASYGGLDQFGWRPEHRERVEDVAQAAAAPFAGRRFAVRVAPGLTGESVSDATLADVLASSVSGSWRELQVALLDLPLPESVHSDLVNLDNARRGVTAYRDVYGNDGDGRPRGVVFVAPFGIKDGRCDEEGQPNSTEDDETGCLPGFSQPLEHHSIAVERLVESFAQAAALPTARIADLKLAGRLHDLGKGDRRFQAWLHYGDPFGPDPHQPNTILAKSERSLPRVARTASGLPERWRHEALSVRLARADRRVLEADHPELVLWLIGTHHGYGRPLFPHRDPTEQAPDTGPQSLAFEWRGLDWASLFEDLKARYGAWELARMEAILRLADHRASEAPAVKESGE